MVTANAGDSSAPPDEAGDDQQRRGEEALPELQAAGRERPLALGGMAAVGLEIENVVEDVGARRHQPEQRQGDDERRHGCKIGDLHRQDGGHEDQRVLGPLMEAHRLAPGFKAGLRALERANDIGAELLDGPPAPGTAADMGGGLGAGPDLEVGGTVADILEPVTGFPAQQVGLGRALVVGDAVAADGAVEDIEARGDLRDGVLVCGGDQPDLAAHRPGPAAIGEDRLVDRQGVDVEDGAALEPGLYLGDVERELGELPQRPQGGAGEGVRQPLRTGCR